LYKILPVRNERLDEFGTGRAIAIGPHIPMQCKLPTNPTKNAANISGDINLENGTRIGLIKLICTDSDP
jgi:hypothetical protein